MKIKLIFISLLCMTLAGCGWFDRKVAVVTGGATKTCIDGVTYLQFTSGATVQVDPQGRPVACQ
jgi:hypothetical protein